MNLQTAIEILTIHNDHNPNFTDAERRQAHQLGIEALKELQDLRRTGVAGYIPLLPGETPIIDTTRSTHHIKNVLESPLGREPKPLYKANEVPPIIFTLKQAQLTAMSFYKHLTSRKDRQPRYILLTFCGATPQQAYKWRDWSLKHFQLIFDYLFNPEPLAEGLVNNRLGSSEEGIKSVAVA